MSEHAIYNHYIYNVIYIILKTSNFNGFKKKEILLFSGVFFFSCTHTHKFFILLTYLTNFISYINKFIYNFLLTN